MVINNDYISSEGGRLGLFYRHYPSVRPKTRTKFRSRALPVHQPARCFLH